MADIATLGLSVESSQVKKGAADLDRLTAAAGRAEAATMGVATGSRQAAAGSSSVSTTSAQAAVSLDREAAAAKRAAQSLNTHTKVANDNVRRMGGSVSGLAAQFQDVGVTAAAGMNPLIIGLQQGTQIAGQMEMALANGGSAASVFGTALKSLLSPVSLLSIGLTVLLAAGLQMVNWPALAAAALNGLASVIETIAPYAVAAAAALALIYAPAVLGGLAILSEAILGVTARLAGLAIGFALANPAVAFVLGITAAVAAANIFRDELTQIFGFDIVGAAKDGINAIIGAFLGAYDGIVASWSALPGAFGDLGYQAANKFIEGINWMVGEVVSIVNGLIAKINGGIRGAVAAVGGDATSAVQIKDLGSPQSYKMGGLNNPYAGSAAGVGNTFAKSMAARQGIDYVGQVGGAISGMASSAADKLRGLAGSFGGVGDAAGKAGGAAGKAAKDATDPWKGLRDVTKQTKDEFAEFEQGAFKGFLSTLRSDLSQGKSLWESFGDAALGVLNKIADRAEDALASAIFPSSGGGGGGLFGSIFSGIGKLFGFASGGYTGGGAANKAAGIVHGGEYVFSKKATDRIGIGALDQMHRRAKGYASGGYVQPETPRIYPAGNQNVQQVKLVVVGEEGPMFRPTIKAVSNGVAVQVVDQRSPAHVQQGIAQYDKGLPGRIADTMERNG